ncbi:leucyl/phenylalanyl-tRNA--protein transferase [Luteococcus sp. OSA5]|uniref:leucyl/phenylalanyl-tRNA--protein transferase n=1 Tax=unclassified Luteococcus TaxID=2639923 RepID=UPI003B42A92C
MLAHVFGPWTQWPDQDLIAFSTEFDEELALQAYCSGLFPMPLHESGFEGEMGWWSPMQRGVLPLSRVKASRSLRKSAKRYVTTVDAAFDEVLEGCADPQRPHGWIDDDIRRVYTRLHQRGFAHSVETWDADGNLVGGLYGVAIRGLFAGESMFHDPVLGRDASKVALLRLVTALCDGVANRVLDVQWRTDHLASLGVVELERVGYLSLLDQALDCPPLDWGAPGLGDALPGPQLLELFAERQATATPWGERDEWGELDEWAHWDGGDDDA